MFKVPVDFAHDEKIQPLLELLSKHKGAILGYDAEGPAGGNPQMLLRFDQRGDAVDYLRERYPDDSLAFCNDRVTGPLQTEGLLLTQAEEAAMIVLLEFHFDDPKGEYYPDAPYRSLCKKFGLSPPE